MSDKIKVLFYGDGVGVSTGFGTVNTNIAKYLLSTGKYEIHNLAINYHGDPIETQKWENLYLYPTIQDPFGRNRLFPLLMQTQPDILFTTNDFDATGHIPEILLEYKKQTGKQPRWVLYFPIDGSPIYPEWVNFIKKFVDKPIVISKYGQDVIKQTDPTFSVEQCYHGIDINTFHPLPEENLARFKEQFDNKFVVGAVGVNQLRKQYPLIFESFAKFAQDKKDVMLFLHTQRNMSVGWDLDKLTRLFNITDKVVFTDGVEGTKGIKKEELNVVYNLFDVYITENCGEGFGFCAVEAAAAKTPLIIPDNTSNTELWEGYAYMIPTNHYTIFPNRDRELIRPIPSVLDAVDALNKMYYDKAYREEMATKAYNRVMDLHASGQLNWVDIGKYFDKVFTELLEAKVEGLDIEEIL